MFKVPVPVISSVPPFATFIVDVLVTVFPFVSSVIVFPFSIVIALLSVNPVLSTMSVPVFPSIEANASAYVI